MVTVVIVDDHAVVREGTRQLLERDTSLTVVGEAGDGFQALQLTASLQPDVILLDLSLPDMSGIEVARRVRQVAPQTKIVILSAYDDDDYVLAALEVGVAAYLLKTVRGQDVVDAIHAVGRGQVILHPNVAAKLRQSINSSVTKSPELTISSRELEVLRLAAQGKHNKEIAHELSISIRTVEGHLNHILAKLGVTSRLEAVIYGVSQHWFTIEAHPPDW
jgi:DNA-binding NarL/FixJ family response regulator